MPRVSSLRFTKDYEIVAEAFRDMVKNPVVTEREEDGHPVIEIEGDFSHFVIEDLDMWEAHLKFEIKDFSIKDTDDREARAILSQGIPGFGEVLFSPTIAYVYKRIQYKIITNTVIERVELDSDAIPVVLSREAVESEVQTEWKDITREFSQKVRIK